MADLLRFAWSAGPVSQIAIALRRKQPSGGVPGERRIGRGSAKKAIAALPKNERPRPVCVEAMGLSFILAPAPLILS
jgi:hypothetical protein